MCCPIICCPAESRGTSILPFGGMDAGWKPGGSKIDEKSSFDVNAAVMWDPWVHNTNLDYLKSFSEMLPHSPYNVFLTQ